MRHAHPSPLEPKKPVDYDGGRDLESLVNFAEAWLGDCPKPLVGLGQVEEHVSKKGAVLGVFNGKGKEYKAFVGQGTPVLGRDCVD